MRRDIPDLGFSHHIFIRLQVEGKGLPHLSDSVEQHLHLHHVLLVPLSELNFCTHGHKKSCVVDCVCGHVCAKVVSGNLS